MYDKPLCTFNNLLIRRFVSVWVLNLPSPEILACSDQTFFIHLYHSFKESKTMMFTHTSPPTNTWASNPAPRLPY